MSNLCINVRLWTWFFQVERDFPFRVRISHSAYWRDKYHEGPQPLVGIYQLFGMISDV